MSVPKSSLKRRGGVYYLHYFEGAVRRRVSLRTTSFQVAKEKQRQFDSARARGEEPLFPTRTPTATVVQGYVRYISTTNTRSGVTADCSYLRSIFGPICPELEHARENKPVPAVKTDKRLRATRIEAKYFEQITVRQISAFISGRVRRYNLQPKTANRYRQVLSSLFSWAMREGGVCMPGGKNPAAAVKKHREKAPEIRYLNLAQISVQLRALAGRPPLQTMVAVLIYAGLRREEVLWLTLDDVDLKAGAHGVIRIRAKTVGKECWQPKTKANRAVPVSNALRRYLERYEPPLVPGRWFFSSSRGGRWSPDGFSQALRKANKKAGLTWNCLDFRHTFGSQLAMKGVSLYKISALMGNSPEICRRHYAALIPEALTDAVEFDAAKPRRTGKPRLKVIKGV